MIQFVYIVTAFEKETIAVQEIFTEHDIAFNRFTDLQSIYGSAHCFMLHRKILSSTQTNIDYAQLKKLNDHLNKEKNKSKIS